MSVALWAAVTWAQGQPVDSAASVTATSAALVQQAVPATPIHLAPTASALAPGEAHLGGKLGIGTDSIRVDENGIAVGSIANTASLIGLDAIYWLSDNSGLDILATVSEADNPGPDNNGNATDYPTFIYGYGLGLRQNLSSPMKGLKIQGLLRFTYSNYSNQQDLNIHTNPNLSFEKAVLNSETFTGLLGLGFEYFLPFCEFISVQSYVSLTESFNDNSSSVTYNPAMATYGYVVPFNYSYSTSYWRTGFLLNGLSLSTLSVHFYF